MKAIGLLFETGPIELLREIEIPVPELQPRDILIRIEAVGVNPIDTKTRAGFDDSRVLAEPKVLGYDGVGIVAALGSEARLFQLGDKVWTTGVINRNGTNSDFMAVDERIVGFAPKTLQSWQAAAVPLSLLTAWEGVFEGMGVSIQPTPEGENTGKFLLILPGAGGVGSFVIQLAKKLAGLTVIATASRPDSVAAAFALGADFVINHHEPLKPQLEEKGINGVDYIYNAFDLDVNFEQYCEVVNPLGKILSIADSKTDLPLNKLKAKRVTFVWELMFTRALFGVDMIQQHHILNEAARLFDCGFLELPDITVRAYSVENLREAHRIQESGRVIGKQVLSRGCRQVGAHELSI